ncbi:enoyl-CoA hydratase [Amaricoccus sp.]|uniref:enoyl-CoA hydratase n=1 Tax=Amaricoccus sp. TaxID=1872485 RepID=UPI001B60B35F|nr:enoyl-CoA hydratase [Amaricoccus sp.]MBP7242748.1 enoyl-CoA hydratase [Amaricoccus sp.]
MAYETVIVEVAERVATVTLNRPQALNALNAQLLGELAAALGALDGDRKVAAIIVTGSEKAFAAGADIKEMVDQTFADMYGADYFAASTEAIGRVRKPIIAAVSGYCLGGGCELAMLFDFIIASDTAKFGQPEINLGVIPAMGGSQRLTRLVGKSKAMDMCLTGRLMDAAEAERAGLVSRVVPAKDLLTEARHTAAAIASKAPLAVMAAKEAVNRSLETTLREGVLFERRLFDGLFATEDQTEGMTAFIEKRTPNFRGR